MDKQAKEKAVNYTPEMIAVIVGNTEPLDMARAKEIGLEIGRSYRSVIAKAKSLKLAYVSKPVPAKKPKAITKVQLVALIVAGYGFETDMEGLEKAPASVLQAFVSKIPVKA
jgi:hypothetical protein